MKRISIAIAALASLVLFGCNKDNPADKVETIMMYVSAETGTYQPWGSDTSFECMLVKEENESEYHPLPYGGIEGFDYVKGHEYELKVQKTTLANPPADASDIVYRLIEIISETPMAEPKPEELPEEAKFKLKMVRLLPYMDLDTPLAAPFDFLTFRILDYNDEYSFPAMPDFLEYYDLIEMSSPGLPDKFTVYSLISDEDGTSGSFTSQWGSYFWETADFPVFLKGYKDGKLIYEYSMTQVMRERDFLGVDWKNGSIVLANPKTNCIYNILDKRYEFLLTDTQMLNDTPYVKIKVANSSLLSDAEYLKEQEEGLEWLLKKYLGDQSSMTASSFRTLPEGADIVETHENATTRAALVHKAADEMAEECFYVIAEAK